MFWRSLSKSLLNCIAVLASGSMALLAQSSSITPNIAIVGGSIGDLGGMTRTPTACKIRAKWA